MIVSSGSLWCAADHASRGEHEVAVALDAHRDDAVVAMRERAPTEAGPV